MRPRGMRGDRGASLIIVLIIVTVVSVVLGTVLSLIDTSLRTTVALADQASVGYGVDGAAQVAIKQLEAGTFAGNNCASVTTMSLSNWIPSAGSGQGASVAVVCTPNPANNLGGDPTAANTSPGNALLTLDPNLTEVGIYSSVNAGAVKVRGAVFSNSAISAPGGLVNTWTRPVGSTASTYNIARGHCTPATNNIDKGVWVADSAYGSTICDYAAANPRGQDPGTLTPHGASYDAPVAPTGNATISACSPADKYQTVTPGRFSGAAALTALNALTGCKNGVVWFQPGTYYFDLPGTWNVPALNLVGGTFNTAFADLTTKPSTWADPTKACVAPGDPAATTSSGVTFVIGGSSQLSVNNSANPGTQLTICASNSASGPPIAIYGLKTALGGSFPVAAQTPCTPSGYGYTACAVITTGNSPKSTLTIQGTTYLPRGVVDVVLNNNTKKIFYWGLITYAIEFSGTGSADVSNPIVDVPDQAPDPTPAPKDMYLTVYVCPGQATCSAGTGTRSLQAKVQLSAASPTTATVLSWSSGS